MAQRGLLKGRDHTGPEPPPASNAADGQTAEVDPSGVLGLQQNPPGTQGRAIGSAGQQVDRGGLVVAGIHLLDEGDRLLPHEDLEANIGHGLA